MLTKLAWTPRAWSDYLHWQSQDKKMLKRINRVVDDTRYNPFTGIGKPEQLQANLSGLWSRRIDAQHRLVYEVENDTLIIISCRYHY